MKKQRLAKPQVAKIKPVKRSTRNSPITATKHLHRSLTEREGFLAWDEIPISVLGAVIMAVAKAQDLEPRGTVLDLSFADLFSIGKASVDWLGVAGNELPEEEADELCRLLRLRPTRR